MTSGPAEESGGLRGAAQRAVPFAAGTGALQILFSLLGMVLLVRYLEPAVYGVWAVLLGLSVPVSVIVSVGSVHMLYRFMPALSEVAARRQLLYAVLGRRIVVGALVFGALVLAFPLYADRLGLTGYRALLLAMTPGFLSAMAYQYVQAGLNVAFRQRDILIANFSYQALFVIGVAAGIGAEQPVEYFGLVYSATTAIQVAIGLVACGRHIGPARLSDWTEAVPEHAEQRSFRRTSYVDDLGTVFLSQDVNRIVLAAFSTPGQVAVFAVAATIVERLRVFQPLEVFRPLATVAFFRRYEEAGTIESVNRMFRFLFSVNRIMTVLVLVLFVPLGHGALVFVFREDYGAAYLPTILLFSMFAVFGMPVGLTAQALKRPRALVYAKSAVVVNIGLGIPLAAEYGATGMATAALAAAFAKNALTYVLLRREFEIRYPWSAWLRYAGAGVAVGLAVAGVAQVAGIFVAGAAGLALWVLALRVFHVLDGSERALLVSLCPDRAQGAVRSVVGA